MEEEFIIDITKPSNEFQAELDLLGNHRLIFSGPFGSGKTFFLKKFFANSDKYLALHLYPVNYSVSRNEDIFEFIKYDVLYELLRHSIKLEKVNVSLLETIPFLNMEEQVKLIKQCLIVIPKIGKPITDVIDELEKVFNIVKTRQEQIQEQDEGEKLKSFADAIEQAKGSIYEFDFYTKLIRELIVRLKTDNQEKEIILIIDDLDRIDPDHTFRLLNIFSAHLDLEKQDENKFGLDKIIFCCDVDNVRTVFHNKFGQDVDFSGYIDKFYSRRIFEFENRTIISKSLDKILWSLIIDESDSANNFIMAADKITYTSLKYVLISLIESNAINLRILLKFFKRRYSIKNYSINLGGQVLEKSQIPIVFLFDFLLELYGDVKSLERTIQKTNFPISVERSYGFRQDWPKYFFAELLLIINHSDRCPIETGKHFKILLEDYSFEYIVESNRMDDNFEPIFYVRPIDIDNVTSDDLSPIHVKKYFLTAIKKYLGLRRINH